MVYIFKNLSEKNRELVPIVNLFTLQLCLQMPMGQWLMTSLTSHACSLSRRVYNMASRQNGFMVWLHFMNKKNPLWPFARRSEI